MKSTTLIAVLGAESTGKTTLSRELAARWSAQGKNVGLVSEYLREFCQREQRTPRHDEQRGVAAEQSRRIAQACEAHDIVIADTTALMPAIYSLHYFADDSLLEPAREAMHAVSHTLLLGLDLPWEADGIMREGPATQARVDAALRDILRQWGVAHSVILGRGEQRTNAAALACEHSGRPTQNTTVKPWKWVCADCDDARSSWCDKHMRAAL